MRAFLLLLCLSLCSASTSVVSNCISLQEALSTENVTKVVVTGAIRCTRANWQVPISVTRNVEMTGDPAESNSTAERRPSVDWTDLSHVVLVERAAMSVHDLVMYQDELGVGGLTVKFVHTREGATAVFAGVVVVVERCSQPVSAYHALIAQIPRPGFFSGEQHTETIGSSVLLVQDVAIWWPNLNSVWQLCNGIIVCMDSFDGDDELEIDQYFETGLVLSTCATIAENSESGYMQLTELAQGVEGTSDDGDGDDAKSTVTVVAIAISLVMFITVAVSYKCFCGRHKASQTAPSYSRRDQSSIDDTSKDGTSSRALNKADIDLMGKAHSVPLQDVVVGTLLGRGGFGRVFKGTWKGTTVAIKVISHGERQLHNELRLPFEAYLSRHISHPNVVQTFLIHTRPKDSPNGITVDTLDFRVESPGSLRKTSATSHDVFSNLAQQNVAVGHDAGELFETWLVLEFCDRGSLWKTIKKGYFTQGQSIPPLLDHVLLTALDVANAMNYLHTLGITHGDLKADNVLLKSNNTDRRGFFCKVSDFGLSRYVGNQDYLTTFTYGTLSHMPPELLKNGIFSTAVDVYSFGILLWELLATTRPYDGRSHGDILMMVVNEGRRPQITDYYPEMYAALIKDCWKQNPKERPKFSEIVQSLKKMLSELESEKNLLLRDVNDSAGSHETSTDRRSLCQTSLTSTVPDGIPRESDSLSPSVVFVSEPASILPQQEATETQELDPPGQFSMDSTESSSVSSPDPKSGAP